MSSTAAITRPISVDHIFLDLNNPRHTPYETEEQAIAYLCKDELVYGLARDIIRLGLNPLESLALIPLGEENSKLATSYMVAEGNRRMCAIKLLNDPDLAPASQRKEFERLAKGMPKIQEIQAVIFPSFKELDIWLDRLHGGVQGGIGRKTWNPEQKTRRLGNKKNAMAQVILDYAEKRNFISAKDRKGKLTTAQRYLGNDTFKDAIGIAGMNMQEISRDRPSKDFDLLIKKFMQDLASGVVTSRKNSPEIAAYAQRLTSTPGLSGKRTEPESIASAVEPKNQKKPAPKAPKRPRNIVYEEEIANRLTEIANYKLQKIYYSICNIGLEMHAPLISVGVWSFFESLTAMCGRDSDASFAAFLSKSRLTNMGYSGRESINSIRQSIDRIADYGNTTKHHQTAANFNGEQLANDMETLKDLILKLTVEAGKSGT